MNVIFAMRCRNVRPASLVPLVMGFWLGGIAADLPAKTGNAAKSPKGAATSTTRPRPEKGARAAEKPAAPLVGAILEITQGGARLGEIALRFYPDSAPNHVRNFVALAKSGFYNGTHFHGVIPGFKIQGGDPLSKKAERSLHGSGFATGPNGQPRFLAAEISSRPHKRGTLSMARGTNLASASSQFFICVSDEPSLDRQYTVFGEVVTGMEVVDRIVGVPRDGRDNPLTDVVIKRVDVVPLSESGVPVRPAAAPSRGVRGASDDRKAPRPSTASAAPQTTSRPRGRS